MRDQYGDVTLTAEPVVKDDREANRLELTIGFRIAKLLTTSGERVQFALYPSMIAERLRDPEVVSRRTQPMYVEHPVAISQAQVIDLPGSWGLDPASVSIDDPSFLVSSSVSSTGRIIRIESTFQSRGDRVEPGNWVPFLADLKKAREQIGWTIWHQADGTPDASSPAAPPLDQQAAPPRGTLAEGAGALLAAAAVFILCALGMGADF